VANVLSKLAMNPTDRVKLVIEAYGDPSKPKEKSAWDELD
jgi:hypothetical protein